MDSLWWLYLWILLGLSFALVVIPVISAFFASFAGREV